jgi:uncharacterized protein (TIGR02246 family)
MKQPLDEGQIRSLIDRQTAAWNRSDGIRWADCFSEDASFVNIMGRLLAGREEIGARHAEILRTVFRGSVSQVAVTDLRACGDDLMIARMDHVVTGQKMLPPGIRPTDPDGTLRTRMLYLLARLPDGHGWHVVAAQNTAIVPAPDGPPPLST